jgi:prolyl-tRNA synthetase
MRVSRYHMPTLKEAPKDAELASHVYLVRGGFIRQLAAGIYDFMPLGVRVLHKVERIIREEMNRHGGIEVLLPAVQPSELWQESGRWSYYGAELLRLRDRHDREFCIGPTHEEVITDLVRRDIRSYRDLPVNLYQIQAKFRDEIKPRGGLLRGREFIMKDAYSFDVDEAGAKGNYQLMYEAYCAIFKRCGLDFRVVEADTGNIGGSMSHEFQVVAETGEDYVLKCPACDFTVNQELGPLPEPPVVENRAEQLPFEEVHTPDQKSVEEVAAFLGVQPSDIVKTLICVIDDQPTAVLVRGDHDLSDVKLRRATGADQVELADDETVARVTGAPVGYAGPVGLAEKLPIVADYAVRGMANVVVGANKDSYHLKNVNLGRDFTVDRYVDVRNALDGDPCPNCADGKYSLFRGIEVGHIFFLGTKYSKAMECTFLNEEGRPQPAVMGCYGIGVTRIISAAIEQNHDDRGITWPVPIAPYEVALLGLQMKEEAVAEASDRLYEELTARGIEVLYDDRPQRPGFKFADAELIGFPYQLVVGARGLAEGKVEVKCRRSGEKLELPLAEAVEWICAQVEAGRRGTM